MAVFVAVVAVSFLLGWRLGRWWVAPVVYLVLALTLAFVFDPAAGQHDVARGTYVVGVPILPGLAAAVGTVIGMGQRMRRG
jgi:hypothetical protein